MRYDSEHKTRTRSRVLDAAAKAIRLAGPERVGVSGVMSDAGLTHGGFYAHFSSKGDLVYAAIEHMFKQARQRFLQETEGKPAAQGLADFIDFYLSKEHRDAQDGGCPIAALSSDLPRLDNASRALFAEGVQRMTQRIADLLDTLGHRDALIEARSTVAELIGALALARTEPDAAHSETLLDTSGLAIKRRLHLTGADT